MSIKIKNPRATEALSYDYIDIENLDFTRLKRAKENTPATYTIKVTYRQYAVAKNGDVHYAKSNNTISMDNFIDDKGPQEIRGEKDFSKALQFVEEAISKLILYSKGTDTEVI
jgi:hypothetical protein